MYTTRNSTFTSSRLSTLAQRLGAGTLLAGLLVAAGCTQAPVEGPDGERTVTRSTGLALTAQMSADADVERFRYTIERTACPGQTQADIDAAALVQEDALEAMTFPGGMGIAGHDYDGDSEHTFADLYQVVEAGCYNVTAEPLLADGSPSQQCRPAMAPNVLVQDGKTTEVLLISQCDGVENGGLDAIASLNVAPAIVSLEYNPSKFIETCQQNTICATARDPENDPLVIEFGAASLADASGALEVVSQERNADGSVTKCISVAPEVAGEYLYDVTVFDAMYDEDGNLQLIDAQESSDTLEFPVYVADSGQACAPAAQPGDDDDDDDVANPQPGDDDDDAAPQPGDDDDGDDDDDDAVACTSSCTLWGSQPAGSQYADVRVTFSCGEVHVQSSKDLSNVVLGFADGTTRKFEGFGKVKAATFGDTISKEITTVWVKSGAFKSGDGPGFGERFDSCLLAD